MIRTDAYDACRNAIWSRRGFLTASGIGVAGLWISGCGESDVGSIPVDATDPSVLEREKQRRVAGSSSKVVDLVAGAMTVDLAGRVVRTVGYGGTLPGPEIRLTAGDELELRIRNESESATTIHWHGLAIRNDMDGVPDMTQQKVPEGGTFTYKFIVPDPGTYWFHPHMGLDLDRGMYAPIIVDDPSEPGRYDVESVLILDDWLDGIDGGSPRATYDDLVAGGGAGGMGNMGGGMGDMGSGASSGGMGSMNDAGDVTYPLHLINGRPRADAPTVSVLAGGRARLRLINAGSDTLYRVAIGGQTMIVTHLDGFPIEPQEVDAVSMSMGERVDVLVQPTSGVWPIVATPEGKDGAALAWLRTSDSNAATPAVPDRLPEHDRRLLDVFAAKATEGAALPPGSPDRTVDLSLTGAMSGYEWGINGKAFGDGEPVEIRQGERLRLRFRNDTMMVHPMHLHGHTFALATDGAARKDTVLVQRMRSVSVDVLADNPGRWMLHCHNTYHLEAGMATELSYIR